MKILLDTALLLWAFSDAAKLPTPVRTAIESTETIVFVSLISLWELRIKETIGKITLPRTFYTAIEPAGYELLPLKTQHIHEYGRLPLHHRDPFDRMLVAQARCDQLALATDDPILARYDVTTV